MTLLVRVWPAIALEPVVAADVAVAAVGTPTTSKIDEEMSSRLPALLAVSSPALP